MEEISYYMQKVDTPVQPIKNLIQDFKGLLYAECSGLEKRGDRKNVYVEEFAETDELRVWHGKEVCRKATTIVFKFYFVGENRQKVIDDFYDYIKNGNFYYWDTKRKKKAFVFLKKEFDISQDKYVGSNPYKEVKITFQNIWGECKNCNENGELL